MKKILSYMLIVLVGAGFFINDAAAKRFGGGRSFGVQRAHSAFSKPGTKHSQYKQNKQQPQKRNWSGILGGVLAGGLLASLLMGHGLATGILSWLILGALVLFTISLWQKKMRPRAYAGSAFNQSQPYQQDMGNNRQEPMSSSPRDFSEDSFLREAKIKFLRLQAAFDQNNIHDIKAFTAPEVFAEIKMQLDERGDSVHHTEFSEITTELLDVAKEASGYLASVRFSGIVIENGTRTPFHELWHFRQFSGQNEWLVGGIQQQ